MSEFNEPPLTSLIAVHHFNCALTTRGGVCDCQPDAAPLQTSSNAESHHEPPVIRGAA